MALPADWRKAFNWSWTAVSLLLLAVVVAPFLLSPAWLQAALPLCEWKARYQRECPACGLTTAFFAIARGDWDVARQANAGAVPLFSLFLSNFILWLVYRISQFRRSRRWLCLAS
jgi:hypothetical protein